MRPPGPYFLCACRCLISFPTSPFLHPLSSSQGKNLCVEISHHSPTPVRQMLLHHSVCSGPPSSPGQSPASPARVSGPSCQISGPSSQGLRPLPPGLACSSRSSHAPFFLQQTNTKQKNLYHEYYMILAEKLGVTEK